MIVRPVKPMSKEKRRALDKLMVREGGMDPVDLTRSSESDEENKTGSSRKGEKMKAKNAQAGKSLPDVLMQLDQSKKEQKEKDLKFKTE